MPSFSPSIQSSLIINEHSSYVLETNPQGLTLTLSFGGSPLFELKEPILLAQGIAEGSNQIHLAYLKATGELCYSIIFTSGQHQTTTLGKLDTKMNRYNRLVLLPVNKVIHIFYATAHLALPEVWRITHLFWNGQTWKSALLGEVVHPRHPLYHVLLDSKSNLHVLMMTFIGNRSVLLTSFFNGTFHIWSKRQESLSIPREVIDMTALMTPHNSGFLFWAAKQPGSDKIEISFASQPNVSDFMSTWQIESGTLANIMGPWQGFGAVYSEGVLNLLINADQEKLVQYSSRGWQTITSSSTHHSTLEIIQKTAALINYTSWLQEDSNGANPLFADKIQLPISKAYIPSNPLNSITSSTQDANPVTSGTNISPDEVQPPLSPDDSKPTSVPIIEKTLPSPENTLNKSDEDALKDLDEPTSNSPGADEALTALVSGIKEINSSLTFDLQSIGEKVDLIPEVLESLIKKNTETLEALRILEDKINQLKTEREVATKKGFWERFFT